MKSTEADLSPYTRFEDFPRENLIFEKSRREFFRSLIREAEVGTGRLSGGKGYNLASLGALSDELLGQARPVIIPGCQIDVRDGTVWGQPPEEPVRALFSLAETAACSAFNQFNGQATLHQIAARLSEEMGWTQARSFALVRGLFLTLVMYRLAVPSAEDQA